MNHEKFVVHFKFCLSPGGGISPHLLKKIWATACRAERVQVARAKCYSSDGFVYSLAASRELRSSAELEATLRPLLARHVLGQVTMFTRMYS